MNHTNTARLKKEDELVNLNFNLSRQFLNGTIGLDITKPLL
jgi:hypothetical protein